MLSTNYRLKLEGICERIANGDHVSIEEMIWCQKLASKNQTASRILRQARRISENPSMSEDSLDGFLNALDLGDTGHEGKGITGFNSPEDIVDFFGRNDLDDEWRRRD